MRKYFFILFVLFSGAQLVAQLLNHQLLSTFTKPFIIPALIGYYVFSRGDKSLCLIFLIALFFSWAGDVLLLQEKFFVLGLLAFLISHLGYIVTWRKHRNANGQHALSTLHRIRMAFPVILYGAGMVTVLIPHLDNMKIPVLLYAGVLCWMVLQALVRYGYTNNASFGYVFAGSVLFMLSDSMLAFNKFVQPVSMAGFWIMLTYIAAQYSLVTGVLRHEPETV
jgi:uncharacterized membrane protein YhhN